MAHSFLGSEEKQEGTPDEMMDDHRMYMDDSMRFNYFNLGWMRRIGMPMDRRGYRHRGHPKQNHGKSSRENTNNFIGLRNRGNTCYVNSS